jgi:hypothetical protein
LLLASWGLQPYQSSIRRQEIEQAIEDVLELDPELQVGSSFLDGEVPAEASDQGRGFYWRHM